MADTHEEQLLSDLLRGIAREDAQPRRRASRVAVLAAVDQSPASRDAGRSRRVLGDRCRGAAMAVLVPGNRTGCSRRRPAATVEPNVERHQR